MLPLNRFPDHDTRAKLEILDMPYHPTLILPLHRPGVVRPGGQRVLSNVESGFPEKRRAYLDGQVTNVRLVNQRLEVLFHSATEWTVDGERLERLEVLEALLQGDILENVSRYAKFRWHESYSRHRSEDTRSVLLGACKGRRVFEQPRE